MAKKRPLTRVVIYLDKRRAQIADGAAKAAHHKNINRLVSWRTNLWLDEVEPKVK